MQADNSFFAIHSIGYVFVQPPVTPEGVPYRENMKYSRFWWENRGILGCISRGSHITCFSDPKLVVAKVSRKTPFPRGSAKWRIKLRDLAGGLDTRTGS